MAHCYMRQKPSKTTLRMFALTWEILSISLPSHLSSFRWSGTLPWNLDFTLNISTGLENPYLTHLLHRMTQISSPSCAWDHKTEFTSKHLEAVKTGKAAKVSHRFWRSWKIGCLYSWKKWAKDTWQFSQLLIFFFSFSTNWQYNI